MRSNLALSLLLLLIAAGCGGSITPGGDASSDAGTTSDAVSDNNLADVSDASAADAPGACAYLADSKTCNTLPKGALLNLSCTTNPPTPQGGALVDGVYALVSVEWDATANPCPTNIQALTRRGMVELCGGAATFLWSDWDETSANVVVGATMQPSGTSIQFQDYCRDTEAYTFAYTAAGTNLVLFYLNPVTKLRLVMTFVRQ
jgi:hypothetical protein